MSGGWRWWRRGRGRGGAGDGFEGVAVIRILRCHKNFTKFNRLRVKLSSVVRGWRLPISPHSRPGGWWQGKPAKIDRVCNPLFCRG